MAAAETVSDQQTKPASSLKLRLSKLQEPSVPETSNLSGAHPLPIIDASKEADTISNCSERKKNVLKIKVKQPGSSSKADDADHLMENSRGGQNEANEVGPATSVSVDAPNRQEANEQTHAFNQNIEEVNSCHVDESRMTTSVGSSVKLNKDGIQELQCTADSKKSVPGDQSSPVVQRNEELAAHHNEFPYLGKYDGDGGATLTVMSSEEVMGKRKKEKKKDKEKKRKRDEKSSEKDRNDPEYLERKRQKKEKKRLEKELAKKYKADGRSLDSSLKVVAETSKGVPSEGSMKLQGIAEAHNILKARETTSGPRLKIKIKSFGGGNG